VAAAFCEGLVDSQSSPAVFFTANRTVLPSGWAVVREKSFQSPSPSGESAGPARVSG
jgi:hypothetical protein